MSRSSLCKLAALSLVWVAATTTPALAQPVNDLCSGAIEVFCGDVIIDSTTTANPESLGTCGTSDGSAGAVWYRFVGTGEEIVLSTCGTATNYDTKLRVYTGGCGVLTCVGGNDDDNTCPQGLSSKVTFISALAVEYQILVHGFSGNSGTYELSVTCVPPPAADPNDLCVDATVITAGTVTGNTLGNDTDGQSSCGNSDLSPSVWYRFVATADLTLRARTCGSFYDTVVSIHSGCPGDLTTEIGCNDDSCGVGSVAQVMAATGVEYWIRVAGKNGDGGGFTLEVDMFDPTLLTGPDVVYTDCTSVTNWGAIGGIRGYSLGSFTCNIGDENLAWGTNTPLLGMNAYKLEDGRLMQLGLSWMKRGTGAAAGSGCGLPCNGAGGSVLGAGCRDVYGSSFNGSQSILGPRSQVNAYTGDNPGSSGASPTILSKRLQIQESDLLSTSALYFIEGVYVAPDDAANGNAYNNASYKRVTVAPSFDMSPVGAMQTYRPALEAWADHGLGIDTPDLTVELTTADIPNEGRFHIGSKVTDLGGGQFLYDYAIFNLNSHRSAGSFSVPIPAGATVSGIGFHDVDHHSGEPYDPTDWGVVVNGSSITWSSPATFAQNADSNALRYGTMYNFWFECNASPSQTATTIGLFRPGTPDSIDVTMQGPLVTVTPVDQFRRGDCNSDGSFDISDAIIRLATLFPLPGAPTIPCEAACDANDDNAGDIADAIYILQWLFNGEALPSAPHPGCGVDPTPSALSCNDASSCP